MTTKTARTRSARALAPLPLGIAVVLAAVAGLLMVVSFPAPAIWVAVFPAIALLLVSLRGRRLGGAFLVGLVYGAVFYFLLVSWTARYLGPLPWAALASLEAVLTAASLVLIALAYRWLPAAWPQGRALALPLLVAGLWTVQEQFLGSWPYGGFPWARVGMTQSESPLAPVTSWVGVSGLSFLIVATVAIVVEIVAARQWRRPSRWIAPAVALVALLFTPLFPTTVVGEMRIAAVQGNGPTGYFDEREPYSVVEAQMKASAAAIDADVDLLAWPEGGIDYSPFDDTNTARRLTRTVDRVGAPLLANTATTRGDESYNTSFLWNADGTATQVHDKRNPVPFGEYVPDRDFYFALAPDLVGLIQREYTPGTNIPLVEVGDVPVGLAICFDVIYDQVIREGVSGGAQVLVFQTNNADFRGTDENLQQLAFARMRAMEAGRSVVNVSTVGTSQIIRADGSTVSSLAADEAGALIEDVELRTGLTPGIVLGPWVSQILVWGSLVGLLIGGLISRRR